MADGDDLPVSRRECGLKHENVNLRIANLETTMNDIKTGVVSVNTKIDSQNGKIDNLRKLALITGGMIILILVGVILGRGMDFSIFLPH